MWTVHVSSHIYIYKHRLVFTYSFLLHNLYYNSYVAETMNNRVLRFFQRPEGVFHGSVWWQGSGSVGPMALAGDKAGNIYIAMFDVKGLYDMTINFAYVNDYFF